MLVENTLFGERDKVAIAIDRLRAFEPEEGYYLAFSGGKDSQCIYHLAVEAGVKFDAHYNLTTVDPPELVNFIRNKYKDVEIHYPEKSMFRLIEKKGLPTRWSRFCCEVLKEHGGEGRICLTGVRWDESNSRRKNRNAFEIVTPKIVDKRVINPIIDWLDEDVWEYINSRNLEYCNLYDEGHIRLGCIGCPLAGGESMKEAFDIWPKYKENYIKAIARFLPNYLQRCKKRNATPFRDTVEGWFNWWIGEPTTEEIDYTDSFLDDDE